MKKILRLSYRNTQNDVKRPEKQFRKKCVYVCVCVCVLKPRKSLVSVCKEVEVEANRSLKDVHLKEVHQV